MPLTNDDAVAIAARFGLSAADALALTQLADDADSATTIAKQLAERTEVQDIVDSIPDTRGL